MKNFISGRLTILCLVSSLFVISAAIFNQDNPREHITTSQLHPYEAPQVESILVAFDGLETQYRFKTYSFEAKNYAAILHDAFVYPSHVVYPQAKNQEVRKVYFDHRKEIRLKSRSGAIEC